jgi:hypothetical protein
MNPTKQDRCFFIVEAVQDPLISKEAIDKLRFKPTKEVRERWCKLYVLNNQNVIDTKPLIVK